MTCLVTKHLKLHSHQANFRAKVGKFSNVDMVLINKYGRNFKPGIPLSKDFRNEVIQMAASRPISEICERYRINRSNVWLPSMSCLRPIRTCFSFTCPRLDDGIEANATLSVSVM